MSCYIKELIEENKKLRKIIKNACGRFYNIGAPLNDNTLKFNKEQKLYLSYFIDTIESELEKVYEKQE